MHKYEIIIYWSDEDKVFIAEVPELPGCAAHGTSPDNALTAIFAPHHTKCKCGPELPTQPKNSNGFSWLILAHPRRPYII